jgi:hypothetical protein
MSVTNKSYDYEKNTIFIHRDGCSFSCRLSEGGWIRQD